MWNGAYVNCRYKCVCVYESLVSWENNDLYVKELFHKIYQFHFHSQDLSPSLSVRDDIVNLLVNLVFSPTNIYGQISLRNTCTNDVRKDFASYILKNCLKASTKSARSFVRCERIDGNLNFFFNILTNIVVAVIIFQQT